DTPLAKQSPPKSLAVLKALAVARIAAEEQTKLVVTTGFETLDKNAREQGLMAGANSVMLNLTPDNYKKNYTIYPGRAHRDESIQEQIDTTLSLLMRLGRAPTDLGISA
ncbi:hypothetical protein ACFL52_04910, partial [Candidatus Margulisiibacteriota bacterium]